MTQLNPPVLPPTSPTVPASPLKPARTKPIRPLSEDDQPPPGQGHQTEGEAKHPPNDHESSHHIDIEV